MAHVYFCTFQKTIKKTKVEKQITSDKGKYFHFCRIQLKKKKKKIVYQRDVFQYLVLFD